MELVANYVDYNAANSLAAVLRWCDTAGLYILQQLPDQIAKEKLQAMWLKSAVMRMIKVEMLIHGAAWEDTFVNGGGCGTAVLVNPVLTRLGNTSYTLQTELSLASGKPLARVETVMVQLDDDLERPVPVPREQLKPLLHPLPELVVPSLGQPPASCFTWTVQVRPSDCDLLGHMNNSSYAVLFEDARCASLGHTGLSTGATSDSHTSKASIEYIAQARAFDILEIDVWWDAAHQAYGLSMRTAAQVVVARAALFPFHASRL
ncbi:unnamed protein product [Symbiodinium sp. CCMP2456]|nr:unnamed protein product [Symbiodinium sp. CCMP2456]